MTRENELLHRIRKGDTLCWEELVSIYYEDIFRYCIYHSPDMEGARDAVQDTFLKVIRYFPQYQDRGKLMLVFMVIISPIFSAEYQTGADSILRCAKYGRVHLAAAKIVTALAVFTVTFLIGMAMFLLTTDVTFGIEGLKASVQMLYTVLVIPALTIGQTQAVVTAGMFLSLLATACCTLFLSARCKNIQDSLKIAVLLGLLPTIISMISSANLAKLIRCILPSGGIGFTNSFLFEMLGTDFVHVGPAVIWTPYLIVGAAAIEIPLFLVLTVRIYCRRESV